MSGNQQFIKEKSEKVYTISQHEYDNQCYQEDEPQIAENTKHEYARNAGNASEDSKSKNKAAAKSLEVTNRKSDEWGGKYEFLMACIATSVGLGNVWRFPFTAYENGGGAFLIPYIIVLYIIGKPFYYLEGLLGQFTSRSCSESWKMAPAMKGLGYGHVIAGFTVLTYYSVLMALTLYYFVASFQAVLPWSYCSEDWKENCVDAMTKNISRSESNNTMSAAELYFRKSVLNELDSIDNGIGLPPTSLLLSLLGSWICIFIITFRGTRSTGKAAYFLAIFPYIIMITLLVRAVTLDGSMNGILFFITPKWDAIFKVHVWYAAITQCFFSLSVCFGPIITYSSHNNFRHKINRDVFIATSLDTLTSLMAGCVIFGILGNLAKEMGMEDISKVVRGGIGLAFISYPDALSRFTIVPQFFSALFFFMMFVLGAGSAMALFGAACDVIKDNFPGSTQFKRVLGLSIIGYCIGVVYVTQGGQWMITLIDYFCGTFIPLIVGVLEMITIFWIYGLDKFLNDIEFMVGRKPGFYWRICWMFITPVSMVFILVYTILNFQLPKYGGKYYPSWAYSIGWISLFIGFGQIIYWIIYAMFKRKQGSFLETLKAAFAPTSNWGPRNIPTRIKWREFVYEKKSKKTSLRELFFSK